MPKFPEHDRLELEKLAVVTLQGGGVYGLTMAGQLSHIINGLRLNPMALAGTSAGAIVAAFYWSGMSPNDIREAFEDMASDGKIVNLLGPFGTTTHPITFKQVKKLKTDADELFEQIGSQRILPISARAITSFASVLARNLIPFAWKHWRLWRAVKQKGVFSGENLEATIGSLMWNNSYLSKYHSDLSEIMNGDQQLQFGHIQKLEDKYNETLFPALFVTATNVRTRTVEVFNSLEDRFAVTPVARAVRASGGFPFVFEPVQVPTRDSNDWYVDGGVISNFPVWVYGRQFREILDATKRHKSAAQRPWVHVGLRRELDEVDSSVDLSRPWNFRSAMFSVLTGGARDSSDDRIAKDVSLSHIVRQPLATTGGPKGVLDVSSLSRDKVREMFNKGEAYAKLKIANLNFNINGDSEEEIQGILQTLLERCNMIFGEKDNDEFRFRTNLYLPRSSKLYRRFWCNMNKPEGHGFYFDQGLTGLCFSHRVPATCNLEKIRDCAERNCLDAGP